METLDAVAKMQRSRSKSLKLCGLLSPHVKKQFRSIEQAERALEEAIRIPSAQHFRDTVLACHDPTTTDGFLELVKVVAPEPINQIFSQHKDSAPKEAQEALQARGVLINFCGNPSCRACRNAPKGTVALPLQVNLLLWKELPGHGLACT